MQRGHRGATKPADRGWRACWHACQLHCCVLGTASNRLRKTILLQLSREVEKDRCLRCEIGIEDPEDPSVDHKVPWLDVSQELSWDLNNIAFLCTSSATL